MKNYIDAVHLIDQDGIPLDTLVGSVVHLIGQSSRHRNLPLFYLTDAIRAAIELGNGVFFRNSENAIVGFSLFALLSQEISVRYSLTHHPLFHPSEWNEGDQFWIIDVITRSGYFTSVARAMKLFSLSRCDSFKYLRRQNGTVEVRSWKRQSKTSANATQVIGRCSCSVPDCRWTPEDQ